MIFGCLPLTSFAKDANVTYSGNSGKLIFKPGSNHSPTDLFANFKNVMPGASLTQKITVKNKAKNNVKVKIYLRSLGSTDEKYNDFLNQLTLTVTKDTDTPLFDAAADQTGGLTEWVCLGTLYSGGELDLNVTLNVPTTLDNRYQNQIGKIKWQFVIEELPIKEPTWKCPANEKHSYHIEEIGGIATFICDDCDGSEPMKCDECGGNMRRAAVVITGGKTYHVYPDGNRHYVTKDGKTHFYVNEKNIIDYYTVGDKKIDIKNVSEYKFYDFYECVDNEHHHTDPRPPQTGDPTHIYLWLLLFIIFIAVAMIIATRKRKIGKDGGEARAKC